MLGKLGAHVNRTAKARTSVLRTLGLGALSLGAAACDPAPSAAPAEAEAAKTKDVPSPTAEPEPYRVLVTGFNDWKELGDPPNLWRCRDNPSCRLLLGGPSDEAPAQVQGGALVDLLGGTTQLASGRPLNWSFKTMPVTWGAATQLPLHDYDLVVHLGLGVYDNFDHILVESGAYNRRQGKDAAGVARDEAIDAEAAQQREAPPLVKAKLEGMDGREFAGYTLNVAQARPSNDYLCNETHYRALQELSDAQAAGARLERVHFVHIPYAKDGDYAALAKGVGGVVLALVE